MTLQDRLQSHSNASPSCWVHRTSTAAGRGIAVGNHRFLKVSNLRVQYIGADLSTDAEELFKSNERAFISICGRSATHMS